MIYEAKHLCPFWFRYRDTFVAIVPKYAEYPAPRKISSAYFHESQ